MEKIVNICLYGPVTDGWSYQDNLLPKYHKAMGLDVTVITSKWVWNSEGKMVKTDKTDYLNEYGIRTIRLDIEKEKPLTYKFKRFIGLHECLEKIQPDIIFLHCFQFLDTRLILKYVKKHTGVRFYVDNHCDFSNSATNWFSKNILHKLIWKSIAKQIEPYVIKFYGVIPARVDFLINMYGLPEEKVELLVMGADDEKVKEALDERKIKMLRGKYGISNTDFLIVTGGKIDMAKQQTLLLMNAVHKLPIKYSVKLIVFGSLDERLKEPVKKLSDGRIVQYIGWIDSDLTYDYFAMADLVVFPGRHSVFWEQVVGIGKPLIVKYWEGTDHVDVGGNVKFLRQDSVEEISMTIESLFENNTYNTMKTVAESIGKETFSYGNIAKRSIEINYEDI